MIALWDALSVKVAGFEGTFANMMELEIDNRLSPTSLSALTRTLICLPSVSDES